MSGGPHCWLRLRRHLWSQHCVVCHRCGRIRYRARSL